jgi:hypothetical protein
MAASFLVSGVLPSFRQERRRSKRVREFRAKYYAWVEGEEDNREWLLARQAEMQRDAHRVGLGTTYVAPPPAIGGGSYRPHQMFMDLLGQQSYSDNVTVQVRLDTLATVEHELGAQVDKARRDLLNPARWIRLAFERIARLPRYLLKTAGFSDNVTNSGFARAATVLWSFLVGAATIASFVLLLMGEL